LCLGITGFHGNDKLAYVTQTTLSVDDAARVVDALRALSPHRRPKEGRYLLRHAEPAGRSESTRAAVRPGDRRRLADQLELEPPARSGGQPRPAYIVDNAREIDPD
jgi:4-hydroxy-3-methylbut-2-enyl diphosphate reductase